MIEQRRLASTEEAREHGGGEWPCAGCLHGLYLFVRGRLEVGGLKTNLLAAWQSNLVSPFFLVEADNAAGRSIELRSAVEARDDDASPLGKARLLRLRLIGERLQRERNHAIDGV